MKKVAIFITIFVSVILSQFIFTNNVKAYDINNVNLSGITDLQYYSDNYSVAYSLSDNKVTIIFWNQSIGYLYPVANDDINYSNDICREQGVCFSRFQAQLSGASNPRYKAYYQSSDNGNTWTLIYSNGYSTNPLYNAYILKTTAQLRKYNDSNTIYFIPPYEYIELPNYLNGYKEVILGSDEINILLSGLSKGSVYIPYDYFIEYGGRLSYFVKNVPHQSWDTTIDNYYIVDSQYVRQDFDISTYPDASYVMFSKYFYLEGNDDIVYSIFIPEEMYSSVITSTINNNGGFDYTYEVIDENDEIQEESFTSLDYGISPTSPLLSDLFSNFASNTFGLTAIVTAPLNLISSITSSSCVSLNIPLPYINSTLILPCMTTIYQQHFGSFFDIYQTITFGIISYWVIVRIFNLVKDFKNPEHDEIEVLDL